MPNWPQKRHNKWQWMNYFRSYSAWCSSHPCFVLDHHLPWFLLSWAHLTFIYFFAIVFHSFYHTLYFSLHILYQFHSSCHHKISFPYFAVWYADHDWLYIYAKYMSKPHSSSLSFCSVRRIFINHFMVLSFAVNLSFGFYFS